MSIIFEILNSKGEVIGAFVTSGQFTLEAMPDEEEGGVLEIRIDAPHRATFDWIYFIGTPEEFLQGLREGYVPRCTYSRFLTGLLQNIKPSQQQQT